MAYSEIVTKAVIGKGKKTSVANHEIIDEQKPSKVLGCWIINHKFEPVNCLSHVEIRGSYDLHLWYGFNQDSDSILVKRSIQYIEEIPIKYKPNEKLQESSEIKGFCNKYPTCTGLKLLSNSNVEVIVEKEFVIDIIGETKLRVQISQTSDEEWALEEEIDNSVNVNYIKPQN